MLSVLTNVFHEGFKNGDPEGRNSGYYTLDLLHQILAILFLLNFTFLIRMPSLHPMLLDLLHGLRLLDIVKSNDFLQIVKLFLNVLIQLSIVFNDILLELVGNFLVVLFVLLAPRQCHHV